MKVKEAIGLLQYGTDFEIKGAYSGNVYHSSRRNNQKNLEKYYEEEVTDSPFYTRLVLDKNEYCRSLVGIWMCDYDLTRR